MKPDFSATPGRRSWAKPVVLVKTGVLHAPAAVPDARHLQTPAVPGLKRRPARLALLALHLLAVPSGLAVPAFLGLRRLGQPASIVDALSIVFPWLVFPVAGSLAIGLVARTRRGALLPALAAGLLLNVYGPYYLPRPAVDVSGPTFTGMTYNVLYSARQVQPFLAQVAAHAPDVIAFQEFQPPKSLAITAALAERYPYQAVAGTFGLFSRFPLAGCELIYSADRDSDIVQRCHLEIQGRRLTIFNVHLRTPRVSMARLPGLKLPLVFGLAPARRDGDLETLFAASDRTPGAQLVLGDFNLTDQSPSYRHMRSRWGDAFRSAGWGLGFTFRSAGLPFPTWRIDYILHSADLAALDAHLGWFDGSDHRPVVARLGFIQ